MDFCHLPVLLEQVLDGLNIRPEGRYLDATAGGGGHAFEVASRLTTGWLLALDRDPEAVAAASERLGTLNNPHVIVRSSNYDQMDRILDEEGFGSQGSLGGVLMDLGVSSHQLDKGERGFSYHQDAPLDMRMSKEGLSAYDVVNGYEHGELARILRVYGEERFAGRIASLICQSRERGPITTTGQLAELVKAAYPAAARREKNPCKKTFQAIRIEVNGEFEHLDTGLTKAFDALAPGGRLAVITFHSLEDRMVKQRFAEFCKGCTCPPDFPICICGKEPKARLVNRKALVADESEETENRRSRSAKLRVLERL